MAEYKLESGESLIAKSKADRTTNTGGIQSGTMYLTSKRLVFCCTPGLSRIALLSKVGSDETTIFAEVARDDIQLKKWLFWNRLIIEGKDTQIVIPKKLLKYLDGVKVQAPSKISHSAASKRKNVAGILGILLGVLGVHKFLTGRTKEGVITIVLSCIPGVAIATILLGIYEGIKYLLMDKDEFIKTYIDSGKGWL